MELEEAKKIFKESIDEAKTPIDLFRIILEKTYENGVKMGKSAKEWISVKDKLPETKINRFTRDFEYVLCFCHWEEGKDVRPIQYGKNHFLQEGMIVDEHVSHWMPLPETPILR